MKYQLTCLNIRLFKCGYRIHINTLDEVERIICVAMCAQGVEGGKTHFRCSAS